MGFDYHAQKHARSSPNSQNSKTCKMRRGRRELRVATNRASIGALDQKLSRLEVSVCGVRIAWEQLLDQLSLAHSLIWRENE
ncbi:hypothetical protein PIB30_069365 [Stylosanthes scabra]|uniref:Uncharacterized protein n=1 Tax=Stylosanthes scabra TaxID=79078 RepID=A0ABU6RNK7_9FABA|nr:hypothetical protein [Stylosanthes scabra]